MFAIELEKSPCRMSKLQNKQAHIAVVQYLRIRNVLSIKRFLFLIPDTVI